MVAHSRNRRLIIANVLGTLGYISIIFQWLWGVVVIANPLLSGDMSFLIPQHEAPIATTPVAAPSPVAVGIVIALTIVIFAFTLYVLWKLPATVGRKAGLATKHAADTLVPLVAHHGATKKERRALSRRLILLIKWGLVLLPVIALSLAGPVEGLTLPMIWIVGLFCAACSSLYFGLQQLLSKLWNIPAEHLW